MITVRQLMILLNLTVLGFFVSAQQRGEIIKSGDSVLDPNGDGFITASGGPFSIDGYYVDEFETNMFGMPIAGDGEADGDAQQSCSTTDLATDTTGYSAYGVLEGDNLIFRFRLAGNRPSVEAYTVLIDTDNRIGPSDPNYSPDNPGFEVDITLIKNQSQGVFVYNLDGVDNCPSALASYPFSTHFQSSVAGTTSCNDADYFYDFYIPFQVLTDEFGITAQSELRFVAVTNVSATCAMGGSISDVGGVNDDEYGSFEEMFVALSEAQCPTALEDLCQTCEGFSAGMTEKPSINQPIKVGESEISGTSEPTANIFVSIFDGTGTLVEDLTTASDIDGFWDLTLSQPLQNEDSITARAQLEGSCSSGISESDISFAVVIINTPPEVSGSTSTLVYIENSSPVSIFDNLSITDVDDTEIDSAWLTVTENYNASEDVITLPPGQGLNITWESALNRVRIYGQASLAIYESVIQGIGYSNTSDNPDISTRSFSIRVHDGLDPGNILNRSLDITPINDAPVLSGDAVTVGYSETDVAKVIDNTITISDLDDTNMEGAIIRFTQGYDQVEDTLQFTDQNGITGSFDDVNGVLTLTGSATLVNYQTALASVKYENLDAGNDGVEVIDDPTTRIISFQVDDGTDVSNILSVNIDMDIAANVAPVFVDNLTDKNPVDTVRIDLLEDTVLDSCLVAYDADGDPVILQPGFTYENNEGIATLSGGLCFSFTPNENFDGSEYISFSGCDDVVATDVLCDNVVVEINIIPVNDPPDIVDGSNNPIDTIYYSTDEDTPDNFCINAIDIESNTLEFTDAMSMTGNGTPSIPDPGILCFDFSPDPDFFGYDTLQLVVCEQGSTTQCDTIIAIVEVLPLNDPPVIHVSGVPVDTIYFDALEDIITQMCVTAIDPDMDNLQVLEANLNEGPGIFEPNPLGDLCWFFQSLKDSTGMVYGEIILCDDANPALCDTIIAAVDIEPVNDPPVIIDENENPIFREFDTLFYSVDEDEPLSFCINATDPDGDPLVLDNAVSMDGNGSYSITDANNLCVTFTPNLDFNGLDQGVLTVCEDGGTDPQCTSIVVIIDILPVNDPPSITNGGTPVDTLYYTTDEDNPVDICLVVDDIEGNPLSIDDVNTSSNDGTFDLGDPDLCISFVPNEDFNGEVVGEVIVCDNQTPALCDTVIVVIDVIPVNDPPEIIDENMAPVTNDTLFFEIVEDEPFSYCLVATDPDNDPLELSQVISVNGKGNYVITDPVALCFDYLPDPDVNGREIGEATVCETGGGLCSSTIIVIDILPVNDPPVLKDSGNSVDSIFYTTDEDTPATFCFGGDDPDINDIIAITSINPTSSNASFTPHPSDLCFDFVPGEDYFGVVTAEVIVCDDQDPALCDTVIVVIDVLPVNDPPVFIHDNIISDTLTLTTLEDTEIEFCFDAIDPENQSLTDPNIISATNLGNYDYAAGIQYCFLFSPLDEINGTEYATITICDDQNLCTELIIEIIIEYVNDPPVGVDDFYEHDIYTSFTGDFTDNDSDAEGTRLTVSLSNGSQIHGQLDLDQNGSFKYTPSRGFVGTEVFTYKLCDTGEDPQCTTVTVTFELYDPLTVWQAVSPNGDGMNDFWVIDGIDLFPNNKVQIFDRYSNLVYEVTGYNNQDKVWSGQSNRGLFSDSAVDGTYFYKIELGDEKIGKPLSGFIILKKN